MVDLSIVFCMFTRGYSHLWYMLHVASSFNAPKVYRGTCGGKFAHTPTGPGALMGNLGTADGWLQRSKQHGMFESQETTLQ